jgi:hypothetical protein
LPEITEQHMHQAEADAREAQRRFLELQHTALNGEPGSRPSAVDVLAAQTEAQHAEQRVEITRRRLEESREAARVEALHAVGSRAVQLAAAAAPDAEQAGRVRQLAELAAAIRARCAGHDTEVRGLYDEAARLHGDPRHDPVVRTGQAGPWVAHMPPLGVKYGTTEVHVIGGAADQAVDAAVRGDVDGALKLLTPVKDHTPQPPREVWKDTVDGTVYPVHATMPRFLNSMIAEGRAVLMSPEEVAGWQASRR